jgi:alpha-D-xyloside xylohydrolase
MTGMALHNVYSLLFNDAVCAVTREVHGHDLVWARASYLGGQRHAAQWSGDSNTSYPAMAATLRGGLSHGLSGVPFWSHDAGGFSGTPSPDLYVRWTQFGALSPLVRLHGTTSRLPWDFPEVADLAIEALRLRYRLLPYLYSAAVESAQTGLPLLRALLVGDPADPGAWLADQEYTLGADLLVAPMTDPGGCRHVYLPEGDWVSYWDGQVHPGGRHVAVRQPLDRIPLFVRRGALIPVAPPAQTVPDGPFPELTVVSWGARSGRALIRDVDGDTTVAAERVGERFEVTCAGPAAVRSVVFARVHGATLPRAVYLNGEPVAAAWQ